MSKRKPYRKGACGNCGVASLRLRPVLRRLLCRECRQEHSHKERHPKTEEQ